jgi:hypothetical protein
VLGAIGHGDGGGALRDRGHHAWRAVALAKAG